MRLVHFYIGVDLKLNLKQSWPKEVAIYKPENQWPQIEPQIEKSCPSRTTLKKSQPNYWPQIEKKLPIQVILKKNSTKLLTSNLESYADIGQPQKTSTELLKSKLWLKKVTNLGQPQRKNLNQITNLKSNVW